MRRGLIKPPKRSTVRSNISRAVRPFRRLICEPLEDRRMLSVGSSTIGLFNVSPALFVENQGQWADESVRYAFFGSGANVLHTDTGPVFQLFDNVAQPSPAGQGNTPDDPTGAPDAPYDGVVQHTQFSVSFDGANLVEPVGLDQAETVFNYYVGEQADWRSDVPTFETVAYENLYDGIDLHTWGRRDSLKYEFHVDPGVDYRQIEVSYEGIDGLWLDDAGTMHVETVLGELLDPAPYIYQVIGGEQVEVAGRFELIDTDTYSFMLSGQYDPSIELVIDPDLDWSTYLGGSSYDYGWGTAVDGAGNAYVIGETESSGWVSGGYDDTHNGNYDAFVAKLSSDGAHLWSTYLGGSNRDYGRGIAVDGAGNAYVTGNTDSSGWVSGGYDTMFNGGEYDGFVAKLSSNGKHLWSTYLGGSGMDKGYGIAVDGAGNAYVSGDTDPSDWVSGGYDTSHNGDRDAFAAKLSSDGAHVWSTYLGGSGNEYGRGIAVDGAGNAYVTGWTDSRGWVSGGYDTSFNGERDAFVAKLNSIPGDANLDEIVNDQDAAILATNWQKTGATWGEGDFNGDGVVNDQDAAILATHWQEGVEGEGEAARLVVAVPAPGDANRDGVVDHLDAAILAAHWRMAAEAAWGDGDFDGDGRVGDADAAILASNWVTTVARPPVEAAGRVRLRPALAAYPRAADSDRDERAGAHDLVLRGPERPRAGISERLLGDLALFHEFQRSGGEDRPPKSALSIEAATDLVLAKLGL